MIWLIFLFLAYVRADDDSLDFGLPILPPLKNTQIDKQMESVLGEVLHGLYTDGTTVSGQFLYPSYPYHGSELVDMLSTCYNNGMAPPTRYVVEMTIWDNVQDKIRTIPKDTVYCQPGYTNNFYYTGKWHSLEETGFAKNYADYNETDLFDYTHSKSGALKIYENQWSTRHPIYLDESAFAAGATAAALAASVYITTTTSFSALMGPVAVAAAIVAATPQAAVVGAAAGAAVVASTYAVACAVDTGNPNRTPPIEYCINTPTSTVKHFLDQEGSTVKIPYPVNAQNARDTAIDYIRKTSDIFHETPAEYCSLWNSISGNGLEYFRPPEYLLNGTTYERKKCEDYGYDNVNLCSGDRTVDDDRQKEYIINHPQLSAINICHAPSPHESFDESDDTKNVYASKRLFCEQDHRTQKISQRSREDEKPGPGFWSGLLEWSGGRFNTDIYTGFIADTSTGLFSTVTGIHAGEKVKEQADGRSWKPDVEFNNAQTRYVKDKIRDAQNAVMTWALQNCKNSAGTAWNMDSDFYCLLGANDITMKGTSMTIPLSTSGVSAGVTRKFLAKRGITFIVKNRASYCVTSEEKAYMWGAKVAFSPGKMAAAYKKKFGKSAKDAAKGAAKKTKELGNGPMDKLRKWRSTAGPYQKWGATTAGREFTKGFRQSFTAKTGAKTKAVAEYWMEEGTCDRTCDLVSQEEEWLLQAGSASFFSSKTTYSYINVWDPGSTSENPYGWNRNLLQLLAHVTIPNAVQVFLAYGGGAMGFLNEFQISLEIAHGSGARTMMNPLGKALTDDNFYGSDNHWRDYHEAVKKGNSDTLCPSNEISTGYANKNGQLCKVNTKGRRLSESYNIPDIAVSDTSAAGFDEETPSRLDKRGLRIQRVVDPVVQTLTGHIHGVQDVIDENHILMNPFRYTTLDETTLTASYNPPPFNVVELKTCEHYGFTTVHLLTHSFNSGLKDIILNYMNTQSIDTALNGNTFAYSNRTINFPEWKYTGSQWSGYENTQPFDTTLDGVTLTIDPLNTPYADEIIQNFKAAKRASGLILGPLKENGQQDLRQTVDNLYGAYTNEFETVYNSHDDCSDIMKCVCVPTLGYIYRKYGDIKDYTGTYMINPIYRYDECKQAIGYLNDETQRNPSEWSRVNTHSEPLKTISTGAFQGCIDDGNYKFVKGEGGSIAGLSDDSIVKLYEIIDPQNSFDYAGDTINVHRQNPFDTMKEKHTAIDTKFHMVEDGQPVRFPRHDFGALKDKIALHTVHDGTFKTIRRVDRYYKKNADVVEEYYIAEDGGHMIEYLNLRTIDPKSNEYGDTTLIPSAHFVANIDDIGTDILVPQMDFVRNGLVAFSGQNINMPQLPCRSLFDYSGPAKYYDGAGGSTDIPGLQDVICGEVAPQLADHVSCEKSLSLPNTCPAGYGMDGEGTDDDGYAFDLGDKRQCAKCPVVPTCNGACERCLGTDSDTCETPQVCKKCLSPSGSYRCEVDLTNCDKPGYVETFVRRGGPDAQVSRHCVKTFEEPAYLPWQASTLQKHHHHNGNPFYPHNHTANGMKWIQNEIYSETRYLVCNPGFVPTQEIFDPTHTLVARITQYSTTCAGYTCKRCPDGFYEKDQICMKCPNRQIANAAGTGCEYVYVPKGHFFDVTNKAGSDGFPFVSSCDHWLDHPGGSMGAYQDEENQIVCKTVNTTVNTNLGGLGRHIVMFKGGIVDDWGVKGWRVSQDRTAAIQCEDHQICNGEEVSGCTHGYIWKEYSEDKDIDPCEQCNVDETIKSDHPSRDDYEFCDGTHRFRCAVASYTEATPDTFQTHIAPHHQVGDIFVGVRASWYGSRLVVPKSEVRGSLSASFRWNNDFNSNLPRAEHYVHNPNFQPRRVDENPPFNQNECRPVPNGTFALPDKWQKTDCGAASDLCVDRTFHKIIPYKKDCANAEKYAFTAGVVKEECYDEIFRGSSRTCTNGEKGNLPGLGLEVCLREPCQEEGATNCWCADEPDFCTMGCVNDLCQEICGDRVCEEYELCYGEFDQFVSFARCAIECQPPISNYCVIRDGENTKYCRHYNDDFNSAILHKAYPDQDTPCFDEVPNIPETQCIDEFATSCFCGREYFDPPHTHESDNYACVNQALEPVCSVPQDDGTCIYETGSGECICGSGKIDLWDGETCYRTSKGCGLNASPRPLCEAVLGSEIPCIAADYNIVDNDNCYNGNLKAVYATIDSGVSYKCEGTGEEVYVRGCVDERGNNHNPYATIPWICNYN